jgi:hypothetical protein
MEPKEFVEEVCDPPIGSLTHQFIRAEAIYFIAGKSQFPVGRYHFGLGLQGGFFVDGKVVFPVHLDDDGLPTGSSRRKSMRWRGSGRRWRKVLTIAGS